MNVNELLKKLEGVQGQRKVLAFSDDAGNFIKVNHVELKDFNGEPAVIFHQFDDNKKEDICSSCNVSYCKGRGTGQCE